MTRQKWAGRRVGRQFAATCIVVLAYCALAFAAPAVTLSATSGPPTTSLLISASGFPASTAVDIYFDSTDMALAVTNGSGSFSNIGLVVPTWAIPGTHWISGVARGSSGAAAQKSFTVRTNWSQYQGSSRHKGLNSFENVLGSWNVGNIDVDWKFATGLQIWNSSAAIVNGTVFVGSSDKKFYAIKASTGSKLWSFSTGGLILSSPAVGNGIVYVASGDGNLYALNSSTGVQKWSVAVGSAGVSGFSPTVANGVVYVGSGNLDFMYALDGNTGAQIWKTPLDGAIYGTPAVVNGVVYIGTAGGLESVYALDAATGTVLWHYQTGGVGFYSSPTVANGVVYIAENSIIALNAVTGAFMWQYSPGQPVSYSSPAVANGILYVGCPDGSVYAISARRGTFLWSFATGASISYSSPTVANGVVYIGSDDKNLYALDANSGAELWRYTTGQGVFSGPVVADGVVYVGSYDGNMYAFDLAGGTGARRSGGSARPDPTVLRPNLRLRRAQGGAKE